MEINEWGEDDVKKTLMPWDPLVHSLTSENWNDKVGLTWKMPANLFCE